MNKSDKIFIAGATGMVGSAIIRNLAAKGFNNLIGSIHSRSLDEFKNLPIRLVSMDLRKQADVSEFFQAEKPAYVFLAAARVGGIHANNTYPAEFIYDNLAMQNSIIHSSYENRVERLLFLGSSCIYPREAPQPMREEYLLTGLLEPTNEPYALAKIAGIKMCEAYNRQYGTRYLAVMPTNLYGPNDNFDLDNSHVLPALIRKFYEAKKAKQKQVVLWGTGSPRREFLHVDDLADAAVHVMMLSHDVVDKHLACYPAPCFVNVGTGIDCSIRELAQMIKKIAGFDGNLVFDLDKPDGAPQKLLNVDRLSQLGWSATIPLEEGVRNTYLGYQHICLKS